ncbi:MAG: 50S ribosomal protein L13 [Patescibacteria group bacterium]
MKRQWYLFDAKKYVLGRLSTRVARLLTGKQHVDYTPNVDMGDFVVIVNAPKIIFTGRKLDQKKYHSFSGYPGGIRTVSLKTMLSTNPERVIYEAVRNMLPKNKLRAKQLRRLKILKTDAHKFKIDKNMD